MAIIIQILLNIGYWSLRLAYRLSRKKDEFFSEWIERYKINK